MIMQCDRCRSPFMHREDNPLVWDSLNSIPIGFCACDYPALFQPEYNDGEYREVYYLATEPTTRDGHDIAVSLDEGVLQQLGWIRRDGDEIWLTPRGRKLFPLMLLIANDLIE